MNSRRKSGLHDKIFKIFGGVAVLIAGMAVMAEPVLAGSSCPQARKTQAAPARLAKAALPASADIKLGSNIYNKTAKPMTCKMCHGKKGDGKGKLGMALNPKPRNFACSETMKNISAGQMFWIIKNGSKGTAMVAHGKTLNDKKIWSVVKYIRSEFVK